MALQGSWTLRPGLTFQGHGRKETGKMQNHRIVETTPAERVHLHCDQGGKRHLEPFPLPVGE